MASIFSVFISFCWSIYFSLPHLILWHVCFICAAIRIFQSRFWMAVKFGSVVCCCVMCFQYFIFSRILQKNWGFSAVCLICLRLGYVVQIDFVQSVWICFYVRFSISFKQNSQLSDLVFWISLEVSIDQWKWSDLADLYCFQKAMT